MHHHPTISLPGPPAPSSLSGATHPKAKGATLPSLQSTSHLAAQPLIPATSRLAAKCKVAEWWTELHYPQPPGSSAPVSSTCGAHEGQAFTSLHLLFKSSGKKWLNVINSIFPTFISSHQAPLRWGTAGYETSAFVFYPRKLCFVGFSKTLDVQSVEDKLQDFILVSWQTAAQHRTLVGGRRAALSGFRCSYLFVLNDLCCANKLMLRL